MYFKSRAEAGRELAKLLDGYKNQQTIVISLDPGGILVGAQIAMELHANLAILIHDRITLPGENEPIATMTSNTFTYNSKLSSGEIDELVGEYRGFIEEQRITKMSSINRLLTNGGEIDRKYLRNHVIIVAFDGLLTAAILDVLSDFLKPIKIKKLILVTPLASVTATDRMHIVGDEIHCLNVMENLMEPSHYYDDNTMPDHEGVMKIIKNISMTWDLSSPKK